MVGNNYNSIDSKIQYSRIDNEETNIIGSSLYNCVIEGKNTVTIIDSEVSHVRIDSSRPVLIYKSEILDTELKGHCTIVESIIRNLLQQFASSLLSEKAYLSPAINRRYCYQVSPAILRNGGYYGFPKSEVSSEGDIITDAMQDGITVNCVTNDYQKWLGGAGRRYGKLCGHTDEQMDEIESIIKRIKGLNE